MRSGGRRRPASPHPRASGPGVRVGRGAKPGAGCSLEPPSPTQLPPEHSVSGSQSAPGLGLKRSHFFYLVRAPCGLHAGLCCLRCWQAAPTPWRKGPHSRRCPRGGGLQAGQGVCVPRMEPGAIASLFVTGVTPSGCPWGPSRCHPSAGELRVRQGHGTGSGEVTTLRAALRAPPTPCRQDGPQLTPPRAPRMPALPEVLPVVPESKSV